MKSLADKLGRYTCLVRYMSYQESANPMIDGEYHERSKVVVVDDLLKINEISDAIIEIKILEK